MESVFLSLFPFYCVYPSAWDSYVLSLYVCSEAQHGSEEERNQIRTKESDWINPKISVNYAKLSQGISFIHVRKATSPQCRFSHVPTLLHMSRQIAVHPPRPPAPLSPCFLLTILCYDRFHTSFSLCVPFCPSSPRSSPFVSLLLWCHSSLTLLSPLRADLPPRPPSPPTESVRPFLCLPSCLYPAWCFSDATEVVWTSVSFFFFFSLCISIGCRSLPCWCFSIRVAPEVKKLYVST